MENNAYIVIFAAFFVLLAVVYIGGAYLITETLMKIVFDKLDEWRTRFFPTRE